MIRLLFRFGLTDIAFRYYQEKGPEQECIGIKMISDSNDEYILSMTEPTIIFMHYTHINMSLVFDSLLNDPSASLGAWFIYRLIFHLVKTDGDYIIVPYVCLNLFGCSKVKLVHGRSSSSQY